MFSREGMGYVKKLTQIFEALGKKDETRGMIKSRSCFDIRQVENSNVENKKSFNEIFKTKRKEVKSFSDFSAKTNDEKTKNDFFQSVIDLKYDPYVLECYNDDGNELVKIEISIQRRAINLNDIDTLKHEAQNSVSMENGNEPVKRVRSFKKLLNPYEEVTITKKFNDDEIEYDEVYEPEIITQKSYPVLTNQEYEGIESIYENVNITVRRETFTDGQGNIGIEHVGYSGEDNDWTASDSTSESLNRSNSLPPSKNVSERYKQIRFYQRNENLMGPDQATVGNFKELLNTYYEGPTNESINFSDFSDDEFEYDEDYEPESITQKSFSMLTDQKKEGIDAIYECRVSDNTSKSLERSDSLLLSKKLLDLIEELKTTEQKYVENLEEIFNISMPYIVYQIHEGYRARAKELVDNLSKIYPKQKKFMKTITKCEDVDSITMIFLQYKDLFDLYPEHMQNKSKLEHILMFHLVQNMQVDFSICLDLFAYLEKRLKKYILLIENMQKELNNSNQSCENTQKVLIMLKSVISRGNDYIAIDSILNSPLSRLDYGSFMMRQKFTMKKPRRLETMVFLFSNVIVFTVEDQEYIDMFLYLENIKLKDLKIETPEDGTIHVIDYERTKRDKLHAQQYTFILITKDDLVRKLWRKSIEAMLWQQLEMQKESLQSSNQDQKNKSAKSS